MRVDRQPTWLTPSIGNFILQSYIYVGHPQISKPAKPTESAKNKTSWI